MSYVASNRILSPFTTETGLRHSLIFDMVLHSLPSTTSSPPARPYVAVELQARLLLTNAATLTPPSCVCPPTAVNPAGSIGLFILNERIVPAEYFKVFADDGPARPSPKRRSLSFGKIAPCSSQTGRNS